jgi:hypothetical protein
VYRRGRLHTGAFAIPTCRILYTAVMTAYGRFQKTQQATPPENAVARRKQARQAVLQRVRRQRAIAFRRLGVQYGR